MRHDITIALFSLIACLCLAGCGGTDTNPPPAFMSGDKYAIVATNLVTDGMPHPQAETLYYYPDGPQGPRTPVWATLTADDLAVFDRLVVFNGGLSSEPFWKFYPALFAYNGNGTVVEISLPACRKIPGWKMDWTNYAFAVLAASNNQVRLDASQRLPVNTNQPKRMEVLLDKADILRALIAAQTNTSSRDFNGISYYVAE